MPSSVTPNPSYTPPFTPAESNADGSVRSPAQGQRNDGSEVDLNTTLDNVGQGGNQDDFPDLPPAMSSYAKSLTSAATVLAGYGDAEVKGDMMAMMALFQQLAQTMRTSQREGRNAETAAQVTSLTAAGDKIIAAADLRFKAANIQADYAIAASAVQIGASVVQMGMAGAGLVKSVRGANKTQMGETVRAELKASTNATARYKAGRTADAAYLKAEGTIQSAKGAALTARSQALGGMSAGISGVIKAAGDKYAAQYEKDASAQDAAGAKDQAAAKMHEAASQNASDVMQAMQDIIRDIREKTQAMEQATVDTNKAIARNV